MYFSIPRNNGQLLTTPRSKDEPFFYYTMHTARNYSLLLILNSHILCMYAPKFKKMYKKQNNFIVVLFWYFSHYEIKKRGIK